MIESISIENFRCFDKLKIKGFKSINLIGGQNNSGKTALLEALLLSFKPSGNTIDNLRLFRNENGNQIRKNNGKVWNYFFYNQDKSQTIKIVANYIGDKSTNLELLCTSDVETVLQSLSKTLGNGNERLYELMLRNFSDNSLLNIKGNNLVKDFNYFIIPNKEKGNFDYIGNVITNYNDSQSFLPSSRRGTDDYLAELYSKTWFSLIF
jgi:AAA15 family ATPase/GTPase